MDSATNAVSVGRIIGVRGSRVFKLNPATGVVESQVDLPTFAFGRSCCEYDPITQRVFVGVWNQAVFLNVSPSNTTPVRNIYRISPNAGAIAPTVDQTIDISSVLGITSADLAFTQIGVAALRAGNGKMYGRVFRNLGGAVQPGMGFFQFDPSALAAAAIAFDTEAGFAGCAYGNVGGSDVLFGTDQQNQTINSYDFTGASLTTGATDDTKVLLAMEFVPGAGTHLTPHLFVTDQSRYIHVYNTALAFVTTIDTGDVNFSGQGIRYDLTSDRVYAFGGLGNKVAVIDPTLLSMSSALLTGYDIPVDGVFSGTNKWAVQNGSVPLRVIP